MKLIIYILLCLGISACEGKKTDVSEFIEVSEKVVPLNDNVFENTTNFKIEGVDFEFISKNGNFDISEDQPDIRTPQTLEQSFVLKMGNENKKIELPNQKKYSYLKDGDTISILDIPIDHFEMFIYKSKSYFELTGGGGCSSCNEYASIYNLNGQLIFKGYYSKDSTIEYMSNPNFPNIEMKNHRKKFKAIVIK